MLLFLLMIMMIVVVGARFVLSDHLLQFQLLDCVVLLVMLLSIEFGKNRGWLACMATLASLALGLQS